MKIVTILIALNAMSFVLAGHKNFGDHIVDYLDKVIESLPIKPQVGPNGGRAVYKRVKHLVVEYNYALTDADMDELHECYFYKYFRYWHGSNDSSKLTNQEAYCQRLIDMKPTPYEATAFEVSHRFLAMSDALKKFSPAKPLYPTENELQELEDCFFFRSYYKEPLKLTRSEAFCNRLERDILNQTEIMKDGSFYPFGAYHNAWLKLTDVARQDYAEIQECFQYERQFQLSTPEEWSGPCRHYYELMRKPITVRDIRRVEVHDCMRARNQVGSRKDECLDLIQIYEKIYCGFQDN